MKLEEKPKMKYMDTLKRWACRGEGCVHIANTPEKAYLGHHNKLAYAKRLRLIK